MAKCTDCGNEIELVEMMEALVAMEEQRGRSFGLLCPECRPPDYIDPFGQLLDERRKEREQRQAMEMIDKATIDQWCERLKGALVFLEDLHGTIEKTKGKISEEDYIRYFTLYVELSVIIEDLNPEELGTIFEENIVLDETEH